MKPLPETRPEPVRRRPLLRAAAALLPSRLVPSRRVATLLLPTRLLRLLCLTAPAAVPFGLTRSQRAVLRDDGWILGDRDR